MVSRLTLAYETTHIHSFCFPFHLTFILCHLVLGANSSDMKYAIALKKPSVSKKKQAGRNGTLGRK